MAAVERTLVVIKPDAVARGLIGRIIQRFEDAGLKVVGTKMTTMDDELTRRHYFDLEERHGTEVYEATAAAIQWGPVIALVVEGVAAVANVRRLLGGTLPSEAAPGTIRGDFAHHSREHCLQEGKAISNLVHASGNADEAMYEISVWFSAAEQFDYRTAAEPFTF